MNEWSHRPLRMTRWEFERIFRRTPKMAGPLDYADAKAAIDRGCYVISVACLGDDIDSYVVTREPRKPDLIDRAMSSLDAGGW